MILELPKKTETITLTDFDFHLRDERTYVATLRPEDTYQERANGDIVLVFNSRGGEEVTILRQHVVMISKVVRTVTVEVKHEETKV